MASNRTKGSEHSPDDLAALVGRNLRRLRTQRGHSLERLAKLSSVSRAMLGQIETGQSVPTIGLLWKVAAALDIPFTTLIASDAVEKPVVLRREQAKVLASQDGRFTSRALFPFDGERSVEFYEIRLGGNHTERAEGHADGTVENLVVTQGSVEIGVGRETAHVLATGDAIVFKADRPHYYRNLGDGEAVLYLVMTNARAIG